MLCSKNNFSVSLACGSLATVLIMPAQARDEPQLTIEEVVVTAQKREESVNDIPATVNVVTSEALSDFALFDFQDLSQVTAGVSLSVSSGRTGIISMRGISFDPDSNAANAVDTYWNGMATNTNILFQPMFDLDRIEILKGAQGTLQGRSSPAGAVMLVTKSPNIDVIDGQLQTTFSENDGFNSQIGISLPLIPGVLAVRAAVLLDENDMEGITNIATGTEQSQRTKAGRLTIAWYPIDTLSAVLAMDYLEREADPAEDMAGILSDGSVVGAFDRKSLQEVDSDYFNRSQLATLTVNWDIADHTVTSLSGYNKFESFIFEDLDVDNQRQGIVIEQFVPGTLDSFSQELRIASSENEVWEYMIGLYYHKFDNFVDYSLETEPSPDFFTFFNIGIVERNEDFGVFTSNVFHISQTLRTHVGLRWQKFRSFERSDGSILGFAVPLISDENDSNTTDAVTGSLKLTYDLTDDVLTYVSIERGYRPAGITITSARFTEDLLQFEEESSDSFELGFKALILDGRLQVNGSAYRQVFDGFIARASNLAVDSDPQSPSGVIDPLRRALTFNADATILGAELEFNALLSDKWTAGGGVSYNDATFDNGAQAPCTVFDGLGQPVLAPGDVVAICDVGGRRVGGEPNWSATFRSEYQVPIGSVNGFVRGLYKYNGSRANDDAQRDSGGYGTADLFTGLRGGDDLWEVVLWAKNLTNKKAERLFITPLDSGIREVSVVPERTVGITGKYNF
jgi:iron complex outermembrane recepter protein